MLKGYSGILTLLTVLLGGCMTTPSGPLPQSFAEAAAPALEFDPSFKAGMDVLGVNSSIESDSWRTDEWVLLGVKVAHDTGHDVWFVRVSTLHLDDEESPRTREFAVPFGMGAVKTGAKFTAPSGRVLVETYDSNGKLLRSSVRSVPRMESELTALDILSGAGAGAGVSADDMASSLTLLQILGGARALMPIRDAVRDHIIQRPSIVGLMLGGFRLRVDTPIAARETVQIRRPGTSEPEPRQQAKFPIMLSGQRLFDCRLVVGQVSPSTGLVAGTTLLEAVHPENSGRRLIVCVLAAKTWAKAKPI